MLNKVILIGRLTRDPELRYTANGVAVATFTLAVDRPYINNQGQRETDFIRIVVWQKLAEVCANNLGKGRLVAVEGRLQIRSYETPDGQKRQISEVVGENVRFLDWPKETSSTPEPPFEGGPDPFGSGFDIPGDDLPF